MFLSPFAFVQSKPEKVFPFDMVWCRLAEILSVALMLDTNLGCLLTGAGTCCMWISWCCSTKNSYQSMSMCVTGWGNPHWRYVSLRFCWICSFLPSSQDQHVYMFGFALPCGRDGPLECNSYPQRLPSGRSVGGISWARCILAWARVDGGKHRRADSDLP